jgi:hypothetical protein
MRRVTRYVMRDNTRYPGRDGTGSGKDNYPLKGNDILGSPDRVDPSTFTDSDGETP